LHRVQVTLILSVMGRYWRRPLSKS
jgi:hypothetical protein